MPPRALSPHSSLEGLIESPVVDENPAVRLNPHHHTHQIHLHTSPFSLDDDDDEDGDFGDAHCSGSAGRACQVSTVSRTRRYSRS